MKALFQHITGLFLSALILMGGSTFPVVIHTCNAVGQTEVYIDSERADCSNSEMQCCSLTGSNKQHTPKSDYFLQQTDCCETSDKTIKLEPYTLSQKSEQDLKLRLSHCIIGLNLFSDHHIKNAKDEFDQQNQDINDLIPLLIRKERLQHYHNQKISSDSLIA